MAFGVEFQRWLKFIIGGFANTAATFVLYLVLRLYLSYQISYFFAYAVGVIFSYWYNSKVVFDVGFSTGKFIIYPLVYGFHYAISAILLWLAVGYLHVPDIIAPLMVSGGLLPVSFYLSRRFLRGFNSN